METDLNQRVEVTIIGNNSQRTITIPAKEWNRFKVGSRIRVVNSLNQDFVRRVKEIGLGKQRNITIPKDEWDLFKVKAKVWIYPI